MFSAVGSSLDYLDTGEVTVSVCAVLNWFFIVHLRSLFESNVVLSFIFTRNVHVMDLASVSIVASV